MITSYTTLKSEIAEWLNRGDLTSLIPTFIQLAEAKIRRTLLHRLLIARSTTTFDDNYVSLPSNFMRAKWVRVDDSAPLTYMPHQEFVDYDAQHTTAGEPKVFTVVGEHLMLSPTPDQEYELELVYFKRVPALSESNPTNDILSLSPDLYLYGALVHSAPYLHDDERVGVWNAGYVSAMAEMLQDDDYAQTPDNKLSATVRGY